MAQGWKSWGGHFGIARALVMGSAIALTADFANLFCENRALAQITPDATLGAERSAVTSNAKVRGLPAELIEGGAMRGANLFHSFQEFNVGNGQRVYFANPAGIENILGRVTGNNLSKIFGTLGVDGGANLFLLNPNGIIFGPNARLDVAGSFVGSTANSLVFGNGYQFSAKNPEAPPLLTIKLRPGLQYGTTQPGATIANAAHLVVGKDLTLVAGNLDLQGQLLAGGNLTLQAQDTVRVRDSVTTPFIATAGGQLLVQGNQGVDIFALNHPESGLFSGRDMVLRSANTVGGDAHYTTGGNFRIEQLNGSLGNLESPNDPIIRASGDVNFDTYTGTSLHILAGGSVTIGSITITGADTTGNTINPTSTPILANVTLSDGTSLVIDGTTRPTLDIRAGTTAFGNPGITGNNFTTLAPIPNTNAPATSASIDIGSITVTAPGSLVFLTNQYRPNPALAGNIQVTNIRINDKDGGFSGNGGDVIIDSQGDITLPNSGRIQTSSETGNAGNVTLIANGSFLMNPGSQIQAVTAGQGNAGNVTMKIDGAVTLLGNLNQTNSADGTAIFTNVEREAVGNGGDINIQAGSLSLIDRVELQALVRGASGFDSAGRGNAGNITINVRDAVVLGGTSQFRNGMFTVNLGEIGNGGNINITAGSLSITNGSLSTLVTGQGRAGNITINVHDTFTIAGINPVSGGSNVLYAGTGGASGEVGTIDITAGTVRIADGALVNASSYNSANSGDIKVNANVLELTGGGQLLALPYAQGNGGNVTLNVSDRLTISGSDPTFTDRLGRFGFDVVTNQGPTSGIYTGYAIGLVAASLGFPVKSTGNGGNISIIRPRELTVDGGELFTGAFNTGNAGTLSITQTGSVNLDNVAAMSTSTFGTGNAGNLFIDTGKLNLQNQSFIVTATAGNGNAGELTIHANDSVEVISGSRITSQTNGSGNGGNLTVETRRLITRNGDISASTESGSSGRGGNLTVRASESVEISGVAGTPIGGLFTSTFGSGQGGKLTVETGRLTVRDGGRVEAGTFGIGQGGTVTVNALESIELVGTSVDGIRPSGISAFSRPPDNVDNPSLWQGNANSGGVTLSTQKLMIQEGAEVTTAVEGRSQSGNAGDIQVQANSVSLSDRGRIVSRNQGQGVAGDINLTLQNTLQTNGGEISASSDQSGGGNITINADDIRLRNGSLVSSSVFDSTGGGGNITINSGTFLALEDSDILANAEQGPGGNITIKSPAFLADLFFSRKATPVGRNPGSFAQFRGNGRVDISADSQSGTSGTVNLPTIDPTRGLTQLPTDLVDADRKLDRRCTPSKEAQKSSFTVTGRGGLPPSPNEPLRGEAVTADWISVDFEQEKRDRSLPTPNPTSAVPKELVEAQGWVISPNGQVILTAQAPTVTPQSPGLTVPPCQGSQTTTK